MKVNPVPKVKKARKAKTNLTKDCDVLFSRLVRSVGYCQAMQATTCPSGALQCAHGFSRRYRATRWDRRNAWALCAGCHMWFTHHPIEWDVWLRKTWGEALYYEIRELALSGPLPDLKVLRDELRAQVEKAA